MPILSLRLKNIGPLDDVEFACDPRVNVLIGPNNCGKTTALLALADILADFSMETPQLPPKLIRSGSQFSLRLPDGELSGALPVEQSSPMVDLTPSLRYRIYVPALRLNTDYRSEGPRAKPQTFAPASQMDRDRDIPLAIRDEQVIQQMVELDYRSHREDKPGIRGLFNSIAELAAAITEGFEIKFAGIGEDKLGFFPQFRTPDGIVPLNVLSQGTQSLIQWIAQLVIGYAQHYDFPTSLRAKPGVLLVDEIDAHLHPSWQRRILPAISSRFPSLQIVCAAHSPMTIAGLKAGQVHLMNRDAKGHIRVSRNETDIRGWSADEIYAGFFGLEPTDWDTATKLKRLRGLRGKSKLTPSEKREAEALRKDLGAALAVGLPEDRTEYLVQQIRNAARWAARGGRKNSTGSRRGIA